MTDNTPDNPQHPDQGDTLPPAPPPGKTVTVTSSVQVNEQTGGNATGVELGTVNADSVTVDSVNTGGGDYTEGDLDKRKGLFVEGGTLSAQTIIGQQNVYPASPAQAPIHQLRAPVSDFKGRDKEIAELVATLRKAGTSEAAAVISGVRGMGGIGKSELAYKVAYELRDVFLDGMLLIDLRGATSPRTPEQALQFILNTLDPRLKLPDDLSQLQVLYRQGLAGKKMLVLADDALDVKQVRPLMPPFGCALLVTSRNRFSLPGMVTLDLEMLPIDAAEALVLEICPRIGEHATKLAKLCGYLPLALRVSASLLRENPSRQVPRYLQQLETERLKNLSDPDNPDDPAASVEASLRLSYEALESYMQDALWLYSVRFSRFLRDAAVLTLLDSDYSSKHFPIPTPKSWREIEEVAEAALDGLLRRSLLEWDQKYQVFILHDLVREFGIRLAIDYYAQSLDIQRGLGDQHAERIMLDRLGEAYKNLGLTRHAIEYHEQSLRLDCEIGNGDRWLTHLNLGDAYSELGDTHRAIEYYEWQLAIVRKTGHRNGELTALHRLGDRYAELGDLRQAVDYYELYLQVARELGRHDVKQDAAFLEALRQRLAQS